MYLQQMALLTCLSSPVTSAEGTLKSHDGRHGQADSANIYLITPDCKHVMIVLPKKVSYGTPSCLSSQL